MGLDLKTMRLNNGKTIPDVLKAEAKRFVKILQEEMNLWYESYKPKVYDRTGNMLNSLTISDYVKVSANNKKFSIDIYFNDNAFSSGLWGDSKVNKLLLMNDGYAVKKDVWFKNIENFGYREGGNFIQKAIDRFNASNSLGIEVNLYEGGKMRSGK